VEAARELGGRVELAPLGPQDIERLDERLGRVAAGGAVSLELLRPERAPELGEVRPRQPVRRRLVPGVGDRRVAELVPALVGGDPGSLDVLVEDLGAAAVDADGVGRSAGGDRAAAPAEQPADVGRVVRLERPGRCQRGQPLPSGFAQVSPFALSIS
jgi:hypothetical protein